MLVQAIFVILPGYMTKKTPEGDNPALSGPWIDIKRKSDRKPLSELVFPPELEGATSELVEDLEDILQQWGFMHLDEGVYRFEYRSKSFDLALMMSE